MIKLRDLQYLEAIDQHRHFGRAADACVVSQPTLSGQIKKLEDQLGLILIERNSGNLMLTPAGEALVSKARKVLQAAHDFEQTAKTLTDPLAGELHVGLIHTIAPYLLPHMMEGLTRALPRIDFYLYENKTDNLLTQLYAGKLDVLIVAWLDKIAGVERYDLFEEPLLLAMQRGHELSRKKYLDLKDLQGQEVLVLEDGHCLREQSLHYCFSAGAHEDARFQATSLETLRYMVASGLGITLLPQLATSQYHATAMLEYRAFRKPVPTRTISLLTRPNFSRNECVRAMVKSIREQAKSALSK